MFNPNVIYSRTVLQNTLGVAAGNGEHRNLDLRTAGRNSDVDVYKLNKNGSRGKFIRTETEDTPVVENKMFRRRDL